MKYYLTSNAINKYEVQIKLTILLTALLLFVYSFNTHRFNAGSPLNQNESTNTR